MEDLVNKDKFKLGSVNYNMCEYQFIHLKMILPFA